MTCTKLRTIRTLTTKHHSLSKLSCHFFPLPPTERQRGEKQHKDLQRAGMWIQGRDVDTGPSVPPALAWQALIDHGGWPLIYAHTCRRVCRLCAHAYIKCRWFCMHFNATHTSETMHVLAQNTHTETHTNAQAGSFWRVRGTEKGGERKRRRREDGGREGRRVVAVFIDNKWWDALVSAWPTEPDDRHAAKRSCDRITHSGALREGLLSNSEGGRRSR